MFPTLKRAWQINSNKGIDNANFLRLVAGAKSGASAADGLALLTGQAAIIAAKGAGMASLVPHQANNLVESYMPMADDILGKLFGEDSWMGELMDFAPELNENYQDFKQEHATWQVGR